MNFIITANELKTYEDKNLFLNKKILSKNPNNITNPQFQNCYNTLGYRNILR